MVLCPALTRSMKVRFFQPQPNLRKETIMGTLIIVGVLLAVVGIIVGVVLFLKNNPKKAKKIGDVIDVVKK